MLRLDNRSKKIIGEISESIGNQLIFSYTPDGNEYYIISNSKAYSLKKEDNHLIWNIPDNINQNGLKLKIQSIDSVKRNTLYITNEITLNTISTVESLNNGSTIMAFSTKSSIIYNSDYSFYTMADEHSIIQIVERDIIMPKNYKVVVSRDNHSQLLTFEANRYFDGIDRSKKSIWIRFINSKNVDGEITAINVQETEDKIIFGWLLDNNVTVSHGTVEFLIEFSGEDEYGKSYLWQTSPENLIVEKGLWTDNKDLVAEKFPSAIEELQNKIKSLEEAFNNINIGFINID